MLISLIICFANCEPQMTKSSISEITINHLISDFLVILWGNGIFNGITR